MRAPGAERRYGWDSPNAIAVKSMSKLAVMLWYFFRNGLHGRCAGMRLAGGRVATSTPLFVLFLRGRRTAQLFCALAQCLHCGSRALATDALQRACGRPYLRHTEEALLPVGTYDVLEIAPRDYQTQAAGRKTSKLAANVRSQWMPKELKTMYDLQKGRCYFCSKLLGRFGARGAFVRDHLRALLSPYRTYSDYTEFGNLALTCWSCNEDKNKRDENAYWKILRSRHGLAWVGQRQRAMRAVRRWRENHVAGKRRKADETELSQLDAIVEADYQKKLEKKRASEARRQARALTRPPIS